MERATSKPLKANLGKALTLQVFLGTVLRGVRVLPLGA